MKKRKQGIGAFLLRITGILIMVGTVIFIIWSIRRVLGYGDDAAKDIYAEAVISIFLFAFGFLLAYLGNWKTVRRFVKALGDVPPIPRF